MLKMEGIFYRDDDNYGHVVIGDQRFAIMRFEDSHKALHGDIVVYDQLTGTIVDIVKRNTVRLLGVLALSSKVSIGLTNKNVPKKRFVPLDKRYPAFAVATKRGMQSSDVYAIVQTDNWLTDKYPSGILERIVGDVGEYSVELECIKLRYGINWKRFKFLPDDYLIDLTPSLTGREDLTGIYCFNIDPPGCKDIDDVLHFRRLTDATVEIGIHIADVSSFIPINSELDLELRLRGESVYIKNGQMNMMPDIMSTDRCSLLSGEPRRAFSVIIVLNNDLEKLNVRFSKSMIINKKSLTYDEAENIVIDGSDSDVMSMYEIGRRLFNMNYHKRVMLDGDQKYDTHTMVEIFMVMANVEVAEMLVKRTPENAIIRTHRGLKAGQSVMRSDDDQLLKAIKLMNTYKMERAKYAVYDGQGGHHVGLGETNYTHFTSPIRRYFDITVHRLLWQAINGVNEPPLNLSDLCNHLNDCHKRIGDAHRESLRLNKIYELYWDSPVMESIGYIVNINDRMLTLYVPDLDIDLEAKIFSDKLLHLVKYVSTEDKFIMENRRSDTMEFKLLQKIMLRVVVSRKRPYVRKKLLVELLDPNPISFIK
jgi:exosome complex exonuclease DIS3/RRP44